MPPQIKFTREDVLTAALDIAIGGGLNAITAQGIAAKLNSSVQPLYSSFASIQELKQALAESICKLFREYVISVYTGEPHLDIWIGELLFAKQFKNLYVSFQVERNSFEDLFMQVNYEEFEVFKSDLKLRELTHDQLHAFYRHMQIHAYGLCVMICNKYWSDKTNIGFVRVIKEIAEVTLNAVRENKILGRSHWFNQAEIEIETPRVQSTLTFLPSHWQLKRSKI